MDLKKKAILYDSVLCVGCGECYNSCKKVNNNGEPNPEFLKERLTSTNFTIVEQYGEVYSRKLCMHCLKPTCVSVCPVTAFEKTELGPVVYHEDRCMGCRYCMQACPHSIPRYEWEKWNPGVRKCTMCQPRLEKGEVTGCTEGCAFEATLSGDMEELTAIAKQRIKDNPESYYPKIYGLADNSEYAFPFGGGTQVLLLAPKSFDQYGFVSSESGFFQQNIGAKVLEPFPKLTANALEKIPTVVSFGAIALGGLYWLTKRKNEIARQEKEEDGK